MAAAVATPALHAGLQAEQLHYRYDAKEVLQEVSLQLAPGELVALIGPNGAGKSSLLKLLAGLLTPQHGQIQLDGGITDPAPLRRGPSDDRGLNLCRQSCGQGYPGGQQPQCGGLTHGTSPLYPLPSAEMLRNC